MNVGIAFQTVLGYDAFNPNTNFRDPSNILNQNGVVFFPGSAPVYNDGCADPTGAGCKVSGRLSRILADGSEQVATAIIGEILAVLHGRSGSPLRNRAGPIHG